MGAARDEGVFDPLADVCTEYMMCALLARLTLTLGMLISAAPTSFAQQTDPASIDEADEANTLAAFKAAGYTNVIGSIRPIIAEADNTHFIPKSGIR